VANAVSDALGRAVDALPISPPRVISLLGGGVSAAEVKA